MRPFTAGQYMTENDCSIKRDTQIPTKGTDRQVHHSLKGSELWRTLKNPKTSAPHPQTTLTLTNTTNSIKRRRH